jgi:hypothetical protein
MIAVMMPIIRPALSTRAPPLLPGLSAASVCMTSSISRPETPRSVRRNALITPAVTGCLKHERLADGNNQLAYPKPLRVAERRSRQAAARQAQKREVGIRILSHEPGLDAGAVGENSIQPRRAAYHMIVGRQVAVGVMITPEPDPSTGANGLSGSCSRPRLRIAITAGPVCSATSTTVREKASSSAASSTSDTPADSGVRLPSELSLISRNKILSFPAIGAMGRKCRHQEDLGQCPAIGRDVGAADTGDFSRKPWADIILSGGDDDHRALRGGRRAAVPATRRHERHSLLKLDATLLRR